MSMPSSPARLSDEAAWTAYRALGDMELRIADLAMSGVELLERSNPQVTAILNAIHETAESGDATRGGVVRVTTAVRSIASSQHDFALDCLQCLGGVIGTDARPNWREFRGLGVDR